MTKKTQIIFLFLTIALLSLFIFNSSFKSSPLATWQFYGNNGEYITGHYYLPEKNSTTDSVISIPEISEKNGLRITQWNSCHLKLTNNNKILAISYFKNGLIQASLSTNSPIYMPLAELNFYLPDDMHWSIARLADGTYKGWIWDNIANQLIPVHYQSDRTTLITGTNYTLMPSSYWLFQRWGNGILLEEYKLDDLPIKDNFIPENDKQRLEQAKIEFQNIANDLTKPLNLSFDLNLWNNSFCE
ncbi:hypothetical protein [Proteus vulgaris]|uniref:hypothetical protein n=1 Tax=Proteus vulgaris TaxID=585 RepID=UPI000C9F19AB|nr:hypothetical protein [Proteus vulgaris]UBH60700.1 hypothetical protein LA322_11270 [Proteus vulgaris]VTP84850.1 Uncharacterised protein [Proteus vulgaris]